MGSSSKPRRQANEETRARIRTTMIIGRLQKHVEGKCQMTSTQVKAADILLRKRLPDLTKTELTGVDGTDLVRTMSDDQINKAIEKLLSGVKEAGA